MTRRTLSSGKVMVLVATAASAAASVLGLRTPMLNTQEEMEGAEEGVEVETAGEQAEEVTDEGKDEGEAEGESCCSGR